MIKIIANHNDRSVIITFPANENVLYEKCMEIQAAENFPPTALIEEIIEPKKLFVLENQIVNLDELNYLAKRFDSFTDGEMAQFFAAMEYEDIRNLKDLINLSFNLDKYTLITDVSDMSAVGLAYMLNTEGCVDPKEVGSEKLARIGYDLLNSNKGIFTPNGLLFKSDKPMEEFYDGQVFPAYAYKDFILSVDISYNGKSESVFLPDSELAVKKAVQRLGAPLIEDCKLNIECENPDYEKLEPHFEKILSNEGIYELNDLLQILAENLIDAKKLSSAIDFIGVSTADNMGVLAENLDELELIEDVSYGDYEAVGRFFVDSDCYEEYEISDDLQDFFDFAEFGEHVADEMDGEFVPEGFMFYEGNGVIGGLRNQLESEESMTMGGM